MDAKKPRVTNRDILAYESAYRPDAILPSANRPDYVQGSAKKSIIKRVTTADNSHSVEFAWDASNVHVEKAIEIRRYNSTTRQWDLVRGRIEGKGAVVDARMDPQTHKDVGGFVATGQPRNVQIYRIFSVSDAWMLRSGGTRLGPSISATVAIGVCTSWSQDESASGQSSCTVATATPTPTPTESDGGTTTTPGDDDEEGEEEGGTTPPVPSPPASPTTPPPAQCTLNATAGTGGSVSPTTRTVNCGGSVTLTATPNQGYHISGWTGGGCSGTGAKCTVTVGSTGGSATTVAVSVTFALNQCTLNATAGAGGSVSPTTRTVNCGGSVTLTATPNQGYHISGWTGGGCSGTGAKCTVTVGSTGGSATTVSVTASFARRATCHLSGSPGTGGSTTSASGPCGSTLTIRATASWPRYQFTGWSGSCSGTGACSVRVGTSRDTTSSTVSVAAGFGKRYCTVTVRAARGGSASGGGRVWCGAVSVPYASSASGGWCVSHFHSTFGVAGQAIPFVICPQTGRGSVTPEVDLTITAYFVLRSSLSGGGPSGQAETPSATPTPSATATATATATPSPSATATPAP